MMESSYRNHVMVKSMEGGFYYANHGVNFDPTTGKIYFFESERITVATCWPTPMAWRKTVQGWRHMRLSNDHFLIPRGEFEKRIQKIEQLADEHGQRLFPFMLSGSDKKKLARWRWYSLIPGEIHQQISPFRTRQWHLLSLLARCGEEALDLVRSSPALAFALASNWVFHQPAVKRPLRSARALLRPGKNQRDILGWLGFPPTTSARGVLAKLVPQSVDISRLLYLRQAMHRPELMKRLAHLPRLNAGALRVLTDEPLAALAGYQLIDEIAHIHNEDTKPQAAYLLRDTVNMFERLFPQRHIPKIRSLGQLYELHASIIRQFNALPPENLIFPPPPVAGNEQIIPVLSPHDLWREGVEMNHCVSSYSEQIALRKNIFVYKVLAPERCTLSIRKSGSGWRISEIMKSCNRPVSGETISVVHRWLDQQIVDATDCSKQRNIDLTSIA